MMWILLGCLQEPKSPDTFDVDYPADVEDEQTDESDTKKQKTQLHHPMRNKNSLVKKGLNSLSFVLGLISRKVTPAQRLSTMNLN